MTQKVAVPCYKADYSPLKSYNYKRRHSTLRKVLFILLVILLLLCIGIFVVIPVTFMLSRDFQAHMVLPRWSIADSNFTDFARYNLSGVRNFYVNLRNNVTLGVWHVLPEKLVNSTKVSSNFETLLYNSSVPVLLYFHGNARVRTGSVEIYKIQRRHFHVIAFDYRGYGDSSYAEITEDGIVEDSVLFYKWLQERTKSDIFVWGHSLGTGVATITLARLKEKGIQPKGLFLEAPFTSSRDVILNSIYSSIFSWLPWFEATILDPVDKNGLAFNVTKFISKVDCPIMIMHAEDDAVIPYQLGRQIYEIIKEHRQNTKDVAFYTFDKALHYGHVWICRDPRLSGFISSKEEKNHHW